MPIAVVVIEAGAVGASVAFRQALAGTNVTILEAPDRLVRPR